MAKKKKHWYRVYFPPMKKSSIDVVAGSEEKAKLKAEALWRMTHSPQPQGVDKCEEYKAPASFIL